MTQTVQGFILTPMEHRSYMAARSVIRITPLALLFLIFTYPLSIAENSGEVENRGMKVLEIAPHDPTSFTQGLEIWNGSLIESSGLYGNSRISEIDLRTGDVIRNLSIDDSLFAEGITVRNDTMIMLTWKSEIALEIDLQDFTIVGNHSYEGQGWGICYNGEHYVMSNGSSFLTFRDPDTFEISHSVQVTLDGAAVDRLNELECVGGTIYANVWLDQVILAINSGSGHVEFSASAETLSEGQGANSNDVLNGIAYDESEEAFWITGKNWTEIYLVDFHPIGENNTSTANSSGNYIFYILTGIVAFSISHSIIQRKKDPETPNFKDHHQ